jgi:hypothetical protein
MHELPPGDLPVLEQVPPPGLQGGGVGDIPTLEQVPRGTLPLGGGGDIPTLEPGPGLNQGTEGEPPLPVICSEEAGLEKDPETGQCVPIEDEPEAPDQPEEAAEEPEEEQDEPEEEQPSEDGGGSEDSDGGNN